MVVLALLVPGFAVRVPATFEVPPPIRMVASTTPEGVPLGSVTVAETSTVEPAVAVVAERVAASVAVVDEEPGLMTSGLAALPALDA
jgi:hypothetical protein